MKKVLRKELIKLLFVLSVMFTMVNPYNITVSAKNNIAHIHGKTYKVSNSERVLLEKLVYAEAGSTNYKSMKGVAQVVLNRVLKHKKSIKKIIFARGQFSVARNGKIYKGRKPVKKVPKKVKKAVQEVIDSKSDFLEKALKKEAYKKGKKAKKYWAMPTYFMARAGNRVKISFGKGSNQFFAKY